MKANRFPQQVRTALNQSPSLIGTLRYEKLIINSGLRSCSAGLLFSYILSLIAGVQFYNRFLLSSNYMASLVLLVFVLLFASLLYIQYIYSEKRLQNRLSNNNEAMLNPGYDPNRFKNNQLLSGFYLGVSIIALLSTIIITFPDQPGAAGLLTLAAIMLYCFGLLLVGHLLKVKCNIGQFIDTIGLFKSLMPKPLKTRC